MSRAADSLAAALAALRARKPARLVGAVGGFRGYALAAAALEADTLVFTVTPDEASARQLAADASFFLGVAARDTSDGPVLLIPEIETSPYADAAADPRAVALRLAALFRLVDPQADPPVLVVASVHALLRLAIPPRTFLGLCTRWSAGDELAREDAEAALQRAGYTRVDLVEDPGTYAVRGGVLDLFAGCSRFPVRLEFDGDVIERLRLFDPESQRSLREVSAAAIHPARETVATTESPLRARVLALADAALAPSSKSRQIVDNLEQGLEFFGSEALIPIFHDAMAPIWEFLPPRASWVIEEPEALILAAEALRAERAEQHARVLADHGVAAPPEQFYAPPDELARRLRAAPLHLTRLLVEGPTPGPEGKVLPTSPRRGEDGRPAHWLTLGSNKPLRLALEAAREGRGGEPLRPLAERLRELRPADAGQGLSDMLPWLALLVVPSKTQVERLAGALRGYGIVAEALPADATPALLRAPEVGDTRVVLAVGELSEGFEHPGARLLVLAELDLFGKSTRRSRARRRAGLAILSQLSVGDYVVHLQHGVGRYLGLVQLQLGGVPGDFVHLEYAGGDKLYLPVYRLHEIERFVAAEAKPPKLDKMGGSTFIVKSNRVKAEVRQMAEELLQLYAQREATPGVAYPGPDALDEAFADSFPFQETPDQAQAIGDTQGDLGKARAMDRLICGDVGFGKTEVALRAAFRVAKSGKQVAVLAPTTVLVQQHASTFRERLQPFELRVEALNRFGSERQHKRVVQEILTGGVDVVVGTHRLLSKDVRFRDLGLVIIDEEQRFGVAHKERFKKFKAQVDVLTLSATPIPRTLHMSLLGLREISMISTPPVDRLAVRTAIVRISDAVLEEGVTRELARGGQVFYVVPKILGIEEHALRIRELVPHARVLVAHGQMPEELLERTMLDFVEHRADVLVSTTIIESGLDIPRANTIFIAHADQFGLAQLYQLRGRVGRSKQRAHCYLMVQALERLSPEAKRRLEAIQRHAELGSGFGVAIQDLEIRGAGELLGARQSGQIQAIGFDAYARVLGEAVAELRGEPITRETDPEIAVDAAAFLPEAYVRDVGQRLDLYRRLSGARDRDQVDEVMSELIDRHGEAPLEAEHLGLVMICKTYGRRLGALAVELRGPRLAVRLGPATPLSADVAARLPQATGGKWKLSGDRVVAALPEPKGPDRRTQLKLCVAALAELTALAEQRQPVKKTR